MHFQCNILHFYLTTIFLHLVLVSTENDGHLGKPSNSNRNIIDSFHIKLNTIIRTQDSRSLGANYLNETEFSSSEECIVWCWQYSPCNLAVFEEKNQGSCYLFDCGPPDDFRCKFTSHNFYTSAILKAPRYVIDQSQWGAQLKHEKDLVKLRSSPTSGPKSTGTNHIQKNSTASTSQSLNPPPTHPSTSLKPTSRSKDACQHYQFQCRNGSECIAIYNVCDGIPQCPDKSDEAPDLHCPDGNLASLNPQPHPSLATTEKVVLQTVVHTEPKVEMHEANGQPAYQYPKGPDSVDTDTRPIIKKLTFPREYSKFAPASSQYSRNYYQLQPNYGPFLQQPNDMYGSNRGYPRDNDYNVGYGRDSYNLPYWNNDNQRNSYEMGIGGGAQQPMNPKYYQSSKLMPTTLPWQPGYNYLNYMMKSDDNSGNMSSQKNGESNPVNSVKQEKKLANELKQEKFSQSIPEKRPENKKAGYSSMKQDTLSSNVFSQPIAISHLHDQNESGGRDTNSAVIALVLGLCITGMLVAVVGCRMKSIKRRISRRGRNLAHDADYLVNGMYL